MTRSYPRTKISEVEYNYLVVRWKFAQKTFAKIKILKQFEIGRKSETISITAVLKLARMPKDCWKLND